MRLLLITLGLAGSAAGGALLVGCGQFLIELAELIAAVAGGILGEAER